MTPNPEIHSLLLIATATALMWVPYMMARILTRGLVDSLANPGPGFTPDPAWAERARSAHANAVENLAVFAPVVIVAAMVGASSPATVLASKFYLGARLVHYVVYAAGIPVVRTLAFLCGSASTLVIAAAALGHI